MPAIWVQRIRALLVPLISAFLCFVFVVIRPLGQLGGDYSFLCYTSLLLFFFPSGRISAQIEATVLGVLGAALGLAWSMVALAIAAYCGRLYGADSSQPRAILGTSLGLMSFVGGFVRSYSPRLTAASRIFLFYPIFLLTSAQSITYVKGSYFTNEFLVAVFAAAFALVPTLLLSHSSSGPQLGRLIVGSLHTTCDLLPLSLSEILQLKSGTSAPPEHAGADDIEAANEASDDDGVAPDEKRKHAEQTRLSKSLRQSISQMRVTYDLYRGRVTRSKVHPTQLSGVVSALRRVARNPLLAPTSHIPGERIRAALERARQHAPYHPSSMHSDQRTPRSLSRLTTRLETLSPTPRRAASSVRLSVDPRLQFRSFPGTPSPTGQHHRRARSRASLAQAGVEAACDHLVSVVTDGLRRAAMDLATVCGWAQRDSKSVSSDPKRDLEQLKLELEEALADFQGKLAGLLDSGITLPASTNESGESTPVSPDYASAMDMRDTPLHSTVGRDHFRLAFYMTALLDLGKDVDRFLAFVIHVTNRAGTSRRWRFPSLRTWFGTDDLESTMPGDPVGQTDPSDRVVAATENENEGDVPEEGNLDFIQASTKTARRAPVASRGVTDSLELAWRRVWDNRGVIRGRIALSHLIHLSRHSRHVLYALKLAAGISLLALPAFLPPGQAGRMWFEDFRGAWTVLSYMYVLEVHTGATLRVGFFRMIGTFLGAVAAFVCTLIAHDNPYALVTLATACSVPISYTILFTTFPGVGIVAGITLPPLLFLNYLGLANGQSAFTLAWHRFVDIEIGIVAAVLVGTLIWPNHARVRYFHAVSSTLDRLTEYYLRMSRDNLRSSLVYQNDKKQYSALESEIRSGVVVSRSLIKIQRDEFSLLPRPIKLYTEIIDSIERLIDACDEVRTLRFSVPRKATVLDMLPIRRELVSAVLINLWAVAQAFRSRAPLPQFLPEARVPLEELMEAIDEQAMRIRRERKEKDRDRGRKAVRDEAPTPTPTGMTLENESGRDELAILYAMAENEALGEVCNNLDELVAAARTLFGTQSFLDARESRMYPSSATEPASPE
ncbi:hypothetical protein EHS25_004990 [Saitozyma podzolica]|uniref:Integral membrane bound transporter domain-containing protein n=1 Tax=Saitozyma podzolica TaxID=1890683 RepID=A0A427Y2C7_9TREE|nr:hypothetical protein EHS25_004990 [Saitozyma podzolica]